jgi:hypothetical protein
MSTVENPNLRAGRSLVLERMFRTRLLIRGSAQMATYIQQHRSSGFWRDISECPAGDGIRPNKKREMTI